MVLVSVRPTRRVAFLEALLTTALWSTSFLLLRYMLPLVPPMTLVGVRYLLAFVMLLAYALVVGRRPHALPWGNLIAIGVLQYGVGQALQYRALALLPVATLALMFSLLPALQALADTFWLREPPSRPQLVGAAITLAGIGIYLPWGGGLAWSGVLMMLGTLVVATIATTLSRGVARQEHASTLYLTMVSMGAGALAILPIGLAIEPPARFPSSVVIALLWLSLANTAGAFSLWNHALRTLTAFEVNIIGNTTIVQVGVLGWLFLGEALTPRQIVGIMVALTGVFVAQLPRGQGRSQSQ